MKNIDVIRIWIIQCYQQLTEDGTLVDNVVVEIIANSEKQALKKAKKLVKRPFFRVSRIIEKEILK